MRNSAKAKSTDAGDWHIRDCYVWAEIYYLDSPTDYRECLPTASSNQPHSDGIILLDDNRNSGQRGFFAFLITVLVCFSIAGYLLYLLIESF